MPPHDSKFHVLFETKVAATLQDGKCEMMELLTSIRSIDRIWLGDRQKKKKAHKLLLRSPVVLLVFYFVSHFTGRRNVLTMSYMFNNVHRVILKR